VQTGLGIEANARGGAFDQAGTNDHGWRKATQGASVIPFASNGLGFSVHI
jgi:hypothetical protein